MDKVLVVDDVKANVELLAYALEDDDYKVSCAYGGPQALEIAVQEQPDVILLDVVMPGMSGLEVCKRLKEGVETRHIPVILVSVKGDEEDVISGLDAGAMDYVSKPFIYPIVAARLRSAVRIRKSKQLLEEMNFRLDMARKIAEKATRSKSEFLANMSHEIRTPLNGVLGMASLLLNSKLTDDQQDCALTIQTVGDSLLRLINDILDFSKIESGGLVLEAVDFELRTCISEAVQFFKIRAETKGLSISIIIHPDVPQFVSGDPARLRQILNNLIGNALKFTHQGEIVVSVMAQADQFSDTSQVHVEVKDTGVGIRKIQLGEIFSAYKQAESSTTREFGGTGLGLSISEKLVEMMRGEIGVSSVLGEGSKFWFSLPLPVRDDFCINKIALDKLDKVRVLIVDTDELSRKVYRDSLIAVNSNVSLVESGDAAIELVTENMQQNSPFSVVLVSSALLGMNGIELGRQLSALAKKYQIEQHLLFICSDADKAQTKQAANSGFSASLVKPVEKSELLQSICQLVSVDSIEQSKKQQMTQHKIVELETLSEIRILVAEDNLVNQKVILKLLQKMGLATDLATDGQQAIDKSLEQKYDLILMDIEMPNVDGFEATACIRTQPGMQDTPIVALTAHALLEQKEKCFNSGMSDFLTKPVNPKALSNMIEKWCAAESGR
ncbi:MAG: response regulator [Pseudomonadales bacterium]|nr:response regulator [Pseudomonadales bacterium]